MKLRLADDLALPPEAVTQTFGILGMRGSGKSNAGVVMAEEMYRAGLHWVALDPKGDWWGIRSGADGKSSGLPVVIFGGRHGDVPLEATGGALVADVILEHTLTCVLDLSQFSEGDKIRFLAGVGREEGFAGRLYRRKGEQQAPMHLFFEEADDYLPQKAMRDKAKLLHDCSRLLLWGRASGIGGTAISQRSARIHKDVLTQIDTLIVFRTAAPQDRKAILGWVEHHGQSQKLIDSLPGLHSGTGWVWSPEWLQTMQRVKFLRRSTFDSGATPVLGKTARRPATLADVDVGALSQRMVETIKRAEAEDPRHLKRRIGELEAELRRKPQVLKPAIIERIQVPVLTGAQLKEFRQLAVQWEKTSPAIGQLADLVARGVAATAAVQQVLEGVQKHANGTKTAPQVDVAPAVRADYAPRRVAIPPIEGAPKVHAGARAMLGALAQAGSQGLDRQTLAVRAVVAGKGGTFTTYLGRLFSQGLAHAAGGRIALTADGLQRARHDDAPGTPGDLIAAWMRKSGMHDGARRMLQALVEVYPKGLTREELGERAGVMMTGGTFTTYLGRLRSRGLIEVHRGDVMASAALFFAEEARR